MPAQDEIIWQAPLAPHPVGLVRVRAGEQATVSLRKAALPMVEEVLALRGLPPQGLEAERLGDAVRFTVQDSVPSGLVPLQATVRTTAGDVEIVDFHLFVRRDPAVPFAFQPPPGASPARVAVAGSFNGWNSAAEELERQPDGSFAGTLRIAPGEWSYKLVVDGEWLADPANPRVDSTGYGNSLLTVQGEGIEEARLRVQPPADDGRTVRVALPEAWGDESRDRFTVVLNNKVIPPVVEQDGATRAIALPQELLGLENNLTIIAQAPRRVAVAELAWDFPGAPRSPKDEVIYFAMTDRFRNGDASNDTPSGREDVHALADYHGGDWAGLRQKIAEGYFDDLGVTSLWLSPANLNTFNVERDAKPPHRLFTSYHGYWPVSMTETNPAFGSMDELRALVAEANTAGIAVLLDFVANHVHRDHPLLQEHPDWITPLEAPDGQPNIRRFDEYPLTTWFDDFLPTLDYTQSPVLTEKVVKNALWWLEQTGADGFRFDAVKHIPTPFWRELAAALDREFLAPRGQRVYTLGETISGRGTVREYLGPDLLEGQFDFPLLFTLQGVVGRGEGSLADLAASLEASRDEYPPGAIMSPLLGNHDVARFLAYLDGDLAPGMDEKELGFTSAPQIDDPATLRKWEAAMALLFALPGPPTLYYGDEIGLTGAGDPDNRRPMPWGELAPGQERVRETVAQLAKVRAGSVALRRGRLEVLHADEQALVLARIAPTEVALFGFARNEGPLRVKMGADWQEWLERSTSPGQGTRAGFRLTDGVFEWEPNNQDWFLLCPELAVHSPR